MSYDFEGAVGKLLVQQGKTKKSLYDRLGLTRQGFDNKLKNQTVSVLELSEMANFFSTSEANLIAIMASKESIPIELSKVDKPAESSGGLLGKVVGDLEELKRFFEEEIRMKNQQIAGLQRTVDVLVGKSEGANWNQLLQLTGDIEIDLLNQYRLATLDHNVLPMLEEAIFLSQQGRK